MFTTGRRELKKNKMDWVLLWAVAILIFIGTIAIVSATAALPFQARVIRTHMIALPLGVLFFVIGWGFNYQIFQDQWKVVYGAMLALLVGVLIFGTVDRGSRAWFHLPFFSVQPSELCRVGLILVLANYLDRNAGRMKDLSSVLGALALTAPFFLLIIKQPDFSAVLVTFPTVLAMLFCAGVSFLHLSVILGYGFIIGFFPVVWTLISLHPDWIQDSAAVRVMMSLSHFGLPALFFVLAAAGLIWFLWWFSQKFRPGLSWTCFLGAALVVILGLFSGIMVKNEMKEYQRKRFEVFLSPETDPRGAGYNLLQAQIAMGSGGFFGRGIFSGTQSRLGFVPERHTDFILAVVGEEMGFAGTMAVIGLYLLMMWRIILAARVSRDQFGYLANCGIFSMFMVYLFINFGMSVGLFPVAGIPLPLVSYGGSNLVATLWAVGIAESVYSRRYALV
ncbi:MAG: FtsW/RodA/SpoVE family cell cycle protein [bacterium]